MAIVPATFDGPATDVTLSNGNLTATHASTASNAGARSLAASNSGKFYFEVTATQCTGAWDCIGVLTAAGTYANLVTNSTNCAELFMKSGAVFSNDINSGFNTGAIANGTVVGVAVDLDNEKVWFRRYEGWNGLAVTLENPATNTGGVSISSYAATTMSPAVGFSTSASSQVTVNFGASSFHGEVPSGFTAGWASTAATFDGTATNVTLSNGNLTAKHSNTTTNSGVRSTNQQNSGKYYFEFLIDANVTGDAVGILTSAGTYTNVVTNGSNCSVVYTSGAIWSNGSNSTKTLGLLAANAVIGVAVDLDNEKVWFRKVFWNGLGQTQKPSTNTGGATIASYTATTLSPAVGFGGTGTVAGDNFTANFGQLPYVMGPPTGFDNWTVTTTPPVEPPTSNYAGGGASRGRMIRKFAKRKREDEEDAEKLEPSPVPVIEKPQPIIASLPPPSPPQPGLMAGIPIPPITVLRSSPVENEDDIEIALLLELLS